MNIIRCLLDQDNPTLLAGRSIKERLDAQGAQHLWSGRSGKPVDTVVIHYTSAVNIAPDDAFNRERILAIFCDYGVSSHYLIERDGTVLQLVPEERKAWHAGGSIMPGNDGRTGVNDFSVGIELVATPSSGFTDAQYVALITLCGQIETRTSRDCSYVGHDEIAGRRAVALGLRADVKEDPGPLFDWKRFRQGLERGRAGDTA